MEDPEDDWLTWAAALALLGLLLVATGAALVRLMNG